MQYAPLIETNSTPQSSIVNLNYSTDNISSDQNNYLCYGCKKKLIKKEEIIHTPMECLNERCQLLENEMVRLKDRDIKSRLQIKELENKITTLEDAMKGLVAPKQPQATPFSFGTGHKLRHQLKKSQSEDIPSQKSEINYDNILPPQRSGSRERVGLFGSLGASSQYP
jgi:hypothetical protein